MSGVCSTPILVPSGSACCTRPTSLPSLGPLLLEGAGVVGTVGDDEQVAAEHLIGAGGAEADATGRAVGVAGVVGGVVVIGDHVEPGAARQGDGLGEGVLALPVEVPVVDPEQGEDDAVGPGGGQAQLAQ